LLSHCIKSITFNIELERNVSIIKVESFMGFSSERFGQIVLIHHLLGSNLNINDKVEFLSALMPISPIWKSTSIKCSTAPRPWQLREESDPRSESGTGGWDRNLGAKQMALCELICVENQIRSHRKRRRLKWKAELLSLCSAKNK